MTRLTITAATLGLVAASTIGAFAANASDETSAPPACSTVTTTGTVSGNHTFGPFCVGNPLGGPECNEPQTGVSPFAVVTVDVCLPSPL